MHLVDTPEAVEAAGLVLGKCAILSIDTETQPSFTAGEWHPTSLLQIATRFVEAMIRTWAGQPLLLFLFCLFFVFFLSFFFFIS